MTMSEDLMCLLYDEACINGTEEKQLKTLAAQNKMSEEKVLAILERNGCDVEKVMGKRGRPPKNRPEEVIEKKVSEVEEKKVIQPEETITEGHKEAAMPVAIPEAVRNLVKQKIELNKGLVQSYLNKIDVIEKEQKELQDFFDHCE